MAFNCSIDFHYNLIKDFWRQEEATSVFIFFHTRNTYSVELLLGTVRFFKGGRYHLQIGFLSESSAEPIFTFVLTAGYNESRRASSPGANNRHLTG